MSPWILDGNWIQEPWRLWTCHIVHYDPKHAFVNLVALALPLLLVGRTERLRCAWILLGLAPILSLSLLPFLNGGSYCGASGLACAVWAFAGIKLAGRRDSASLGCLMLGLLGLKFAVEALTGAGILIHEGGWQTLPESHAFGTLLGIAGALAERALLRLELRGALALNLLFRRWLTFPR